MSGMKSTRFGCPFDRRDVAETILNEYDVSIKKQHPSKDGTYYVYELDLARDLDLYWTIMDDLAGSGVFIFD